MKERPILFSAPMVRAILVGRKTQTRRVVKLVDTLPDGRGLKAIKKPASLTCLPLVDGKFQYSPYGGAPYEPYPSVSEFCPYGKPGDRLWVRENGWERPDRTRKQIREGADTWAPYYYDADGICVEDIDGFGFKRRPSIHMPRWASRITLEITSVRVERLRDISGIDSIAEGIEPSVADIGGATITTFRDYLTGRTDRAARQSYQSLWESIHGPGSWDANPFVWVLEFKRVEGEK